MISRLSGKLIELQDQRVILDVGGIGYEVWIPAAVMGNLLGAQEGDALELVTLYYLQLDTSKAVPILIGFEDSLQKEFFEKLLTVPRMGPKAALGTFARPMGELARAIEREDSAFLRSLPGIGAQKAKDIIATLQGKVAKYLVGGETPGETAAVAPEAAIDEKHRELYQDGLQMLLALGYRRAEADRMVRDVLRLEAEVTSVEDLVRLVYKRQQSDASVG